MFCTQYEEIEKKKSRSSSFCYSVWQQSLSHIKIRRVTRFTLCARIESYKTPLRQAAVSVTRLAQILADRNRHVNLISNERKAYKTNQENDNLNPSEYMSLVVDGADQSAFGLPHFVTVAKKTKCHSLKLIGVL